MAARTASVAAATANVKASAMVVAAAVVVATGTKRTRRIASRVSHASQKSPVSRQPAATKRSNRDNVRVSSANRAASANRASRVPNATRTCSSRPARPMCVRRI